ncbi:hypothetical protein HanRHA438_Chr10g0468061 [Helianthus annuus]|nr:hypothetical protein HanIR_Chr10g0490741 [Helianthus annuus]KAJ0880874.1 hypothetical protein HanRHA438_Chr10g0468061 [Helianthus annuus]
MDWMSKPQAEIFCKEKIACISLHGGDSLIVSITSTVGAQKCFTYPATLSLITGVRPEELLGFFPPHCQEEYQMCITLEAVLISGTFYRLAPGGLPELPKQLQELLDGSFLDLAPRLGEPELYCGNEGRVLSYVYRLPQGGNHRLSPSVLVV